jgi:hypothetical protein
MKKHTLRALCMAFVLTLCLPMVACDLSNMQFGGLVGELMAGNNIEGEETLGQIYDDVIFEDILPDIEIETAIDTNWAEDFTGDIYTEMPTEDITYDDAIEFPTEEHPTTEPPIVDAIPDPVLHFAFDECDAWVGDTRVQQFFTPGQHASWDGIAIIEDHNVDYVRVRGWVAFSAAQIGEIGYCIDYDTYEFNNAFFTDTEQPVIDAALSLGAQSASRIEILIPVRQLSGKHVIEIVARDENGYLEIIGTFQLEKAVDPYAPQFLLDANALLKSAAQFANDLHTYMGEDGSFVTMKTLNANDPYFVPVMPADNVYANVRFIIIAYRTNEANASGELFVGSQGGPTGQGDQHKFDYVGDGAWHTYVLDLSKVEAINANFDLAYLRYDTFTNPSTDGQSVDLAYVAGFDSMEDVMIFQSQNKLG